MTRIRQAIGSYQNISLDDVCTLVKVRYEKDELKQEKPINEERTVFCMLSSITQNEFYNAGRNGHKPVMTVYLHADEYDDERELIYRGETFVIYRSFIRIDGYIELSCERRVGVK